MPMIYVQFTIICASILQDDDQGESVALSLLCSRGNTLMEFLINYVCKWVTLVTLINVHIQLNVQGRNYLKN